MVGVGLVDSGGGGRLWLLGLGLTVVVVQMVKQRERKGGFWVGFSALFPPFFFLIWKEMNVGIYRVGEKEIV